MEPARHTIAVLVLVTTPISLGLWYAIHPFARCWRRIGAVWTYAILSVPCLLLGSALWAFRRPLIGADLGSSPILLALMAPALVIGVAIARARRRHLTERILTGVPELSSTDKGHLITEGIYARVRNPRYLEFFAFLLAYVLFANHAGIWILYALAFPTIHGVVLLEERELRDRFGDGYEDYCRRVPRYLPRRQVAAHRPDPPR
jgi:protein-S-isoprenylcysteine O-methyltransferase Ste14